MGMIMTRQAEMTVLLWYHDRSHTVIIHTHHETICSPRKYDFNIHINGLTPLKKDGDELVLTLRHVKRTLNDGNHVVKYGYEIFHIM